MLDDLVLSGNDEHARGDHGAGDRRHAATLGPGRVVGNQEIRGAAVGLRHLPVDRNLGVGVGRQLLDGSHRIAVEAIDQGFNHGQCIRR